MALKAVRRTAPVAAAAVALTGLTGLAAAQPVAAASCRPATDLLSRAPVSTFGLPGGASVRIWDTGNKEKTNDELRIAAVRIPKGALTPGVITAPTLARAATPGSMAAHKGDAVVIVNGGHFDPTVPGIPEKGQVVDGRIRKGRAGLDMHVAVYASGTADVVKTEISGTVATPHGALKLSRWNWQQLTSSGVNVFTNAWGGRAHPYGRTTVVVENGRVVKTLAGKAGNGRPTGTQFYLTASSGPVADALARLRKGDAVSVSKHIEGRKAFAGLHAPLGRPTGIVGAGATVLLKGSVRADCSDRNEIRRPRSVLGWTSSGDLLVVAIAGRGSGRTGGATVHQAGEYMRRLGVTTAVNLDGGTSTTLLVRKKVGGPLYRLDQRGAEAQRPVVDALAFRAR